MFFSLNSNIDYMIVGLGNPGKKYENTRHNIGFEALDAVAKKYSIDIKKVKFNAIYGIGTINGKKVMLLKPQTFMNLSGDAIAQAAKFYKINTASNVIILFDDISLAPGIFRIRKTGSAGGHNGLKSIISHIGQDFLRIKIGVGEKPHKDYDLADWVLSRFTQTQENMVKERFDDICAACEEILKGDIDKAMNLYSK